MFLLYVGERWHLALVSFRCAAFPLGNGPQVQ